MLSFVGFQWATGASPASADWSAEPLVAPVDFSAVADLLALSDWSISTDPAAAPGSAPAAEDSAIDDTLSTNGPLATEDTLAYKASILARNGENVQADIISFGHMFSIFRSPDTVGYGLFSPVSSQLIASAPSEYR